MNKWFAYITIVVFLFSCTRTMSVKQFADKENLKLVRVTQLSLFNGVVKHADLPVKYEKDKETFLFFREDSLQLIALRKPLDKDNYLFKFRKINDSINIISRESFNRYYNTDTSLFSKDYCIRKFSTYSFEQTVSNRKLLKAEFRIYHFDANNLIYQQKNLIRKEFENPESILVFFKTMLQNPTAIQPYATQPFIDKEKAMFSFFTTVFY